MVRNALLSLFVLLAAAAPARARRERPAVAAAPAPAVGADKSTERLQSPLGCDRVTIADGLPNSNVEAIVQDKLGFVWFGTPDGLARYDGNKIRVYRSDDKNPKSVSAGYITALTLDPSGKLWVGTADHGVDLYDPQTDAFTRIAQGKTGLSSEGVAAIARDPKGRVWFAMSGGGLNRYEPGSGAISQYLKKPLDIPITAIDADQAGNLWLGTANEGVLRWNPDDGSLATFHGTAGAAGALGTAPITALRVDGKGIVWIGSDGDGVFRLDPATQKTTRFHFDENDPTSLSDDHIKVIFVDAAQNLWIGTPNGLNRLDAAGHLTRFQHDPNDPDNPTNLSFAEVDSIFEDAGGVMWVGGFTGGVCKFDNHRMKFGPYRTRTYVKSFYEAPNGTLWAGTLNGLYKYDWAGKQLTVYHSLGHPAGAPDEASIPLESVWMLALTGSPDGTLWICVAGQGLIAFDPKTETYRQYKPDPKNPNSLPVDFIYDIWRDDQGILWLASWGGGLVRFDPASGSFSAFTDSDGSGISSNFIYSLYRDPIDKQILWVGTAKGGLDRFDLTTHKATSFRHKDDDPNSLSFDDVDAVYRQPDGTLWVGTFGGGLNRLDPKSGKAERFTTSNSKLTNNAVFGILPDDQGNLWMSTNGGGLLRFDPKARTFRAYDASDGLQDNEFSQGASLRSRSGKLLFGGADGLNAFVPKDITRDTYVPPVVVTGFKVFNQELKLGRPIWTLPPLEVSYSDSFEIEFAALSFASPKKNRYAYKLEGFDDKYIETDRPFATYTKLGGGKYVLHVRAANQDGVWNEQGITLRLRVTPPFWRTWKAYAIYLLLLGAAAYLLMRWQRQRVREAEREGRLAVVERDLELTGAVQTGFLPENSEISTPKFQLVGVYKPADACGGDWWWHEPLPGGRHVVMVGDVTGHGPGPAMVTAAVATAFRVLTENGLQDVQRGLEMLNQEVLRVAKGKYHMTMAALEIDEATGHWILYSAGAPPILSLAANGKHRVHFCAGAPLGTHTGFETGRTEGVLQPQDRLIVYTDGIPEIQQMNGNVLGMRRFALNFEKTRGQQLRDAAAAMLGQAVQALGPQPQNDDWTFTLIEWG